MKRILLTSTLIMSILCGLIHAQDLKPLPFDTATTQVTYSGIMEAKGTRNELASRAYWWWAQNHIDDEEYIHYSDLPGGHFIAHGFIRIQDIDPKDKLGLYLWYTIYFSSKDGNYQYILSDMLLSYTGPYGQVFRKLDYFNTLHKSHPSIYVDIYTKIDMRLKNIIAHLNTAMQQEDKW